LVHATHLLDGDLARIADNGAVVCMCPTTEADLGDGLGPAGALFHAAVPLCLGTDGQTTARIWSEAARLEQHARLQQQRRNVLCDEARPDVAANLWRIAAEGRALRLNQPADLVAIALDDPCLVGVSHPELPGAVLFSSDSRAVREVFVGGVRVAG
jgi:cytosine/adenosine deaminase-related metal-dependent hydrolase